MAEVERRTLWGMEKMSVGSGAAPPGADGAEPGAEFDLAPSPAAGLYPSRGVPGRTATPLRPATPSGGGSAGAGAASIPPAGPRRQGARCLEWQIK